MLAFDFDWKLNVLGFYITRFFVKGREIELLSICMHEAGEVVDYSNIIQRDVISILGKCDCWGLLRLAVLGEVS